MRQKYKLLVTRHQKETAELQHDLPLEFRVSCTVADAQCMHVWLQGCTNNLTFGDPNLGYYETIGGGAGAGPGWHGRSGVHTHMTNTRITDPEILERRYPVGLFWDLADMIYIVNLLPNHHHC